MQGKNKRLTPTFRPDSPCLLHFYFQDEYHLAALDKVGFVWAVFCVSLCRVGGTLPIFPWSWHLRAESCDSALSPFCTCWKRKKSKFSFQIKRKSDCIPMWLIFWGGLYFFIPMQMWNKVLGFCFVLVREGAHGSKMQKTYRSHVVVLRGAIWDKH